MTEHANFIQRIMKRASKIEAEELRAVLLSFAFVFTLMAAYYILRPVRDAMASDWSRVEVSWLWTSTFVFSVIAVIIYGGVISRIRFKHVVPGVYGFFSISFATAPIAWSKRASSPSKASSMTVRLGIRNPSLSITTASPMATPCETAIPCSDCI